MGDMSCNCAFSVLVVGPRLRSPDPDATELEGTPQSSRSGRLSSSSAQSIWLPGVEGLWSIAKARTCSTSESMFDFAEKLVTVGPAERFGGDFSDGDSLACGDDGPERDFRAFIADASISTVKFSDDIVGAAEGLLCDRLRRVDSLEDVVEAECGVEPNEVAVGDAGCIVNEGSFSAAFCGARLEPPLGFSGGSTPGGEEEEEFLLVVEGGDTIEGVDFGGVLVLFSVVGEP